MNACVSTAALLLLLGLGADAAAPDLTVDNFETTLSGKSGVWVLDFYAPWCGHCKHLAPIWDQAADKVAQEGLDVHFAKMDCTVRAHYSICERYSVSGFPSLRVISPTGKPLKKYRGGRDVDGIVAYAKRLAAPAYQELKTTKDVKDFIDRMQEGNGSAFILFRPEEANSGYKELEAAFLEAAEEQADVAEMAVAPEYTGDDLNMKIMLDGRTLQEDDGLGGKLAVFREGAGKCLSTAINRTTDEVSRWIGGHRFIMMPQITSQNYKALAFEKVPINAEYLAAMKTVAREAEDDFGFGYIDGKQWEQFVLKYGISTRVLPRLLIMDIEKEYYLPVPVDIKGHDPTMEYLRKVKSGEMLAGFLAMILMPIGWMMWTDYADKKRAATYANLKKEK